MKINFLGKHEQRAMEQIARESLQILKYHGIGTNWQEVYEGVIRHHLPECRIV